MLKIIRLEHENGLHSVVLESDNCRYHYSPGQATDLAHAIMAAASGVRFETRRLDAAGREISMGPKGEAE